jgi:drug/metabolite transporter (DMT)-like permease
MERSADSAAKGQGQAILQMLLCATLWSVAGVFIKSIPWSPLVIAGGRSLIAAGVAWGYMRLRRMRMRVGPPALLCGAMLCLTFFSFVTANKLTTSANAVVLQYSAPVFILLISAAAFHQRFRPADFWVVALTLLGITLCFVDRFAAGSLLGNGIGLFSGMCFAGMFVTTGRADAETRMTGIVLGHLMTAAIGLPFAFFLLTPFSGAALVNLFLLGTFQLGVPYVLYGLAAERCPPLAACLLGIIEPLLNPIWVWIFTGELPGPWAIVGGVVVILSVTAWSVAGRTRATQ